MRFRIGLGIGLAGGYVLGTKAGKERYEQIKRWFRQVTGSPQAQHLAEKGKEIAGEAGRKGVGAVQRSVSKVGSSVRDRLSNGHTDVETEAIGI
jgi:hypothetical protein